MAINKVEANGQTLIDLTSDTATANDVIEGKTLHLASGAVATGTYRPSAEIEARLRATVGHSSKNLLEITAETQTINGVTFTVDRQTGTVTANGTATAQATYEVGRIENNSDENVNYYLSGGADEGSEQTYFIIGTSQQGTRLKRWDGTTDMRGTVSSNSNVEMQIAANSIGYIRIFIRKNIECSNLVFKPMVRNGSISDDTFEPYQTPTDEAKQDKPVVLDPTVLTWNIADLQSKYTHIQIICECISTSSTPDMDIYDVITIPTIIFGRTANSEKYIAFASGTSFSGVDGVYFTEANGNVTADITSSTGHGTRNIIQIIGIPK